MDSDQDSPSTETSDLTRIAIALAILALLAYIGG
jgi:hypothetical protein